MGYLVEGARALLLLLPLVQAAPACDCPPTDTELRDGESMGGLAPSTAVAPLLGEHTATVTWVVTGGTTTLHFTIERATPTIEATTIDCGLFSDHTPFFQTDVDTLGTTDDGLLHVASGATLKFGPDGHIPDPTFTMAPDFDTLKAAGVAPSWALGGFGASFDVPTEHLQPVSTTITMPMPEGQPPFVLATVEFQP